MDTHVWNDPRYAQFFYGAEDIVTEFRWETRWGWPPSDAMLARLIGLAVNSDIVRDVDNVSDDVGDNVIDRSAGNRKDALHDTEQQSVRAPRTKVVFRLGSFADNRNSC